MANYKIEGMKELQRAFKELGKVPQTVSTQAARSGSSTIRKRAKSFAPVGETGELHRAFVLKKERTKVKGKAVYDVIVDPKKNDVFVKIGRNGKRSYYPSSQEYGFKTVDGGYIPGYRYMRRAADSSIKEFERKTMEAARKAVDKALSKARG